MKICALFVLSLITKGFDMKNKAEQNPHSGVERLTRFYKAAPGHLGFFAVAPGRLIYAQGSYLSYEGPFAATNSRTRMHLAGVAYCSLLTVLPVLPTTMAFTLGLAVTAGVITALSAPVAYPIAMATDKYKSTRNNP